MQEHQERETVDLGLLEVGKPVTHDLRGTKPLFWVRVFSTPDYLEYIREMDMYKGLNK